MTLSKIKIPSMLPICLGMALAGVILWFYWDVLSQLAKQLTEDEDFSFGLLLPLVSGYIAYLKWPVIRRLPWRPSWWGLAVIAFGLALFVLGELATDRYTSRFSFVIVLAGFIFLMGSGEAVRQLFFPILLLVLMIPLPFFITQKITLPLQLLSSRLATELLHLGGIPAVREGNVIDLGVRQLQVVAACSGLRYILSLLALTIIFCYFFQRRGWKVFILLGSIIPAAIVANALRVAGMGVFPALQEGFWHTFSGWLIFIFCFALLGSLNWILNWLQPPPRTKTTTTGPEKEKPTAGYQGSYARYLLAALALVILAGPLVLTAENTPAIPLRQSFDKFPMQIGPWQGHHLYIDPVMVKATKASTYLNMEFVNPPASPVSLWIAYYENQKAGGSVHSPFSCLTGSGWLVLESGIKEVAPGLPVKYMLMEQSGVRHLVYYWYMQRGRWLTSEYWNKIYLGYDGLISRRADGALIRLIISAGADYKSAQESLTEFSRLLGPVLPQFIPN